MKSNKMPKAIKNQFSAQFSMLSCDELCFVLCVKKHKYLWDYDWLLKNIQLINNNKTQVSNYGSNCDHLHPSLSKESFDDTKDECEKEADMQLKEETVIEITKANDSQSVDPSTNLNSVYFFLIMIFGGLIEIILCQWNLSNDNISGIYVILLYLHLIFVYGQGLLTFLFFFNFSETKEMIRCILNRSRRPSRSDYLEI